MTVTREQLATLNTLMADHHGQEMLVEPGVHSLQVWLYTADELIATATVDDLGGIRVFEWTGAIA